MSSSTRRINLLRYPAVIFIALLSFIPFYTLLAIGLSKPGAGFAGGSILLPGLHIENFVHAWQRSTLGLAIVNSTIITVGAVLLIVVLASAAGFSIARFPTRLNRSTFNLFLAAMMIPGIINTVALYIVMIAIHGINTHWAMIFVLATNALPFSVFLYTSFIRSMPREVEESAIIDGCTWIGAFRRVTFHFLKPVTASVIILQGLGIWNNYAQAVFFLQSQQRRTVPLAVSLFFQRFGADWNLMAAAAAIGVAPAVLMFIVFQRYFIKGITAGALKG
jgi:raffinose/stachyose/melibiose transport system permease protein